MSTMVHFTASNSEFCARGKLNFNVNDMYEKFSAGGTFKTTEGSFFHCKVMQL